MKKFIALLISKGYTQAPWNKCPQGFEKANYPCYQHSQHNAWVQLYIEEKYGHIYSDDFRGGRHFDNVADLKTYLPKNKK